MIIIMRKPSFIFFLLLLLLLLLTSFSSILALDDEEEVAAVVADDLRQNLQLFPTDNQLQPAPPPLSHPKHDKSSRTGRPLYKQVAPFPGVGEDLNGGGHPGEPVQDDNDLLSGDRLSQQPPMMPPLPPSPHSALPVISRTNLSAGYRCDGVQRFCAEGLTCETFSPYHLGNVGAAAGGNGSALTSHHNKRSTGYHLVEGVCSQRTCESKCDIGLTSITIVNSMKCPADSYLVQWVMFDGGGGEGDDGSKPCCIQTCKCIPDICSSARRNCSFLYERASLGTHEPGNCCDTIQCPEDTEPEMERSKHPQQQQVAKSPAVSAPKTSCVMLEESDGETGEERLHGERWFTGRPNCKVCHCQSGVRVCNLLKNCPLHFNCTDSEAEIAALADDQCCRPCKSCVNPLRTNNDLEHAYSYRHGESWFSKDHCTECRCTDGQPSCYSETCQAPAVACARDQSWAPLEGAGGAGGNSVSCCHTCTCHLDCGKGVPYQRSPITGLEVCDCNLTAAASDLQLMTNEISDNHETINHLLSTVSPGELVSLSGDAAAAAVNTSPPSVDPCLEIDGTSCKKSDENFYDTASWKQISVAIVLVVLIVGFFFVARLIFWSPNRCGSRRSNTSSGGNSFSFKDLAKEEQQLQQTQMQTQQLSAPVDESQEKLLSSTKLTAPTFITTTTIEAGS